MIQNRVRNLLGHYRFVYTICLEIRKRRNTAHYVVMSIPVHNSKGCLRKSHIHHSHQDCLIHHRYLKLGHGLA